MSFGKRGHHDHIQLVSSEQKSFIESADVLDAPQPNPAYKSWFLVHFAEATGRIPRDEEHRPPKPKTHLRLVTSDDTTAPSPSEDDMYSGNLHKYIEKLKNFDPKAARTFNGVDSEHARRVEEFTSIISKDMYDTLDARLLTATNATDAHNIILEYIHAIIQHRKLNLSPNEISTIAKIMEDDLLGLGPLEDILDNDNITDILVDGPHKVFVEINGIIEKTNIHFRSDDHLQNVCNRIVSRVGRAVNIASPICDARLQDGSRVNITLPPLAVDGTELTIRKFKKDPLTLDQLVQYGSLDEKSRTLLQIIAASKVNVLVSGGTGSGKTTMLNCLTRYIAPNERIITCEDAAELQLQQPMVVRMETRSANSEGIGEVNMRELVRNCLRMRPDRIIVGEVRGAEAFDLLQAMNTGHDGSMGTLHANSPRDAVYRLENMIAMTNLGIPSDVIRSQISSSIEVIVQVKRLRDGSRKVTHICELSGMEEKQVLIQDLVEFEILGDDDQGKLIGRHKFHPVSPIFREKAREFGFERDLLDLLSS